MNDSTNDRTGFLRRAVDRFLDRSGMAPARLGREALGDPTFVHGLRRGRVPRLDTADRLLAFMGERPVGPDFRREVEAFLAVTGIKPYVFGLEAAANPSFVQRLMEGSSPRLGTVGRVRCWMDRNSSDDDCREIRRLAGTEGPAAGAAMARHMRQGTGARSVGSSSGHSPEDAGNGTGDRSRGRRCGRSAGKGPGTGNGAGNGVSAGVHRRRVTRCACEAGVMQANNQLIDMNMKDDRRGRMNGDMNGNPNGNLNGNPIQNGTGYLSTTLAASFLGLSPRTLDRYRVTGEGPEFYRFGSRIRYRREDLESWAAARRMRSTSDDRHPSSSAPKRED